MNPLRRSPLRPPTLDQVRAWQRRPRAAIAKVGRKGKREAPAITAFSTKVKAQANGLCEGYIHEICGHLPHPGTGAHHIWPEDRDAGRHEPGRGVWLCTTAHRWVHDHPHLSAELGLLRPDRV